MNKKKIVFVVRQKHDDEEWDPEARGGDLHAVAAVADFQSADEAVRKDAERVLRKLGYSKRRDRELWDEFVSAAVDGRWARPCGEDDDEAWRWTALAK